VLTIRHVSTHGVRRVSRDDLDAALAEDGYVWVDLDAPTDTEEGILHELGVHPLAIEDMAEDRHLPKLETFGTEVALTVHGLAIDRSAEEVDTVELDVALEPGLLVTFHERPLPSLEAVARRLDEAGMGAMTRPVLLLHRLLDTLNDVLVPFVDHFERRLDVIEEDLMGRPTDRTRHDLYRLQRDVIQLRRVVVPQAEVIRRLGRESVPSIEPADRALFRDVHDHLYRMAELSDSYRQLLDSAMDSYRSSQDDQLNDMLRVLTLVSALLLPISVIAGIYGTNFAYMPELGWRPAYFVMWGVFVLILVSMVSWFRHRGWVGRHAEREAERRRLALRSALEVPVLGTVLKVPLHGVRSGVRGAKRTGRRLVRDR
jgi:magnesium transporter